MPDRPITVLTYAASASLAAVALVYFFTPNYLIDGESSTSSAKSRKKGVVGLFNPANDCFINSILQALAGLGDLRLYLIRELHRRELGGSEVYATLPLTDSHGKKVDERKQTSLQSGEVTQGLKSMIDRLNERPIYKKTISASDFIGVLEHAFGTTISKSQQDAQELLQIVAERLSEEYHAGREARRRAKKTIKGDHTIDGVDQTDVSASLESNGRDSSLEPNEVQNAKNIPTVLGATANKEEDCLAEEEDDFPLEGATEARTECQHCHFMPKASPTSFVMLNLMVPQKLSTTLDECLDAHFKKEFIDDYKCDRCRLEHAVEIFSKDLAQAKSDEMTKLIRSKIESLQRAIAEDPEKAPEGVELPSSQLAPKRQVARHVEITKFPKVLVMHLSRSMYNLHSSSIKNFAKISFPEKLAMGGLLNRKHYKLLGMVTHKGTHNSGHYETFRRQHSYAPFSTPHVDRESGPYSTSATPAQSRSRLGSPKISQENNIPMAIPMAAGVPQPSGDSHTSSSSASKSQSPPSTRPTSGESLDAAIKEQPRPSQDSMPKSSSKSSSMIDMSRFKRKKRPADRWWRISDDKVKECKTGEVLSMQKEVYMLFYEMDKDGG